VLRHFIEFQIEVESSHVQSAGGLPEEIIQTRPSRDTSERPRWSMADFNSIMELDEVPEHLLVLGGGYIGLEFGQMFRRFEVT